MVLLPVVERELRVAARGRAIYRVRFYAALVMLGLFVWCMSTSGLDQTDSDFGEQVISFLLVPAFVLSLFIGVLATADCVSSEKREGTLGLLFLTDLKGYDVICGKLAANSLSALYGLLAILPVLGLPVMLGGVTFGQFAKLAVVLFNTMVFSLSAGILVSTYSRNDRKAMFLTVLILLAVTFLPIMLTALYDDAVHSINERDLWRTFLFSPVYGIIQTMDNNPSGSTFPEFSFWLSSLWQWLLAAALIARASAHVPHSWEESGAKKKPRLSRLKIAARVKARSPQGRALLERNPFLWLAMQDEEASRRNVWLFVCAILAIWGIAGVELGSGMLEEEGLVVPTIFVLHGMLKIWIAAEASRRFSEDRSNHTFETLLSTPLGARQIIRGQWLALFKQFAAPIAAVLVWETFIQIHWAGGAHSGWQSDDSTPYWPRMCLLPADAAALSWGGMWLGLKCKGRIRAILASLALVLLVPELVTQMMMAVGPPALVTVTGPMLRTLYSANQTENERWWEILAVLFPALLMDGLVVLWARSRLPKSFRQLAMRQ